MVLTIRLKLALLAGVPMIGAAILSTIIVTQAKERVRLAESLGSIDSLVELSERTTNVIHEIEAERTTLCLVTGYRRAHEKGARDKTAPVKISVERARFAIARTDASLRSFNGFLSERNESALPKKLSDSIKTAKHQLTEISSVRAQLEQAPPDWEQLTLYYSRLISALIGTVSGLTELSNDGELLRTFNALVSILQLEAQSSAEQAVVAHALSAGEFPPGSFRAFVTAITAQELYLDVFETTATYKNKQLLDQLLPKASYEPLKRLRAKWQYATDEDLNGDPEEWISTIQEPLSRLGQFESTLHTDGKALVVQKLAKTKQDVLISTSLAGAVLLFSLIFAGMLAIGITRRLSRMRDVVKEVGDGNLEARVAVDIDDELGRLGDAFNKMIGEIGESRVQLGTRARMARDLEIATEIQQAMVPKEPTHPEFEFAGNMVPADEVGGDFYDVLTDGKALWLTVGDVCGHGIGSGLVMLMTQVAFASNFLSDANADPAQVWRRVNRLLSENIQHRLKDDRYVTAQLLAYRGNGRFCCVGAHQFPIVYRKATGRCELYDTSGPWLGIDPEQQEVPQSDLALEPGDVLCLYSDGLPESQDKNGDLFDLDRMQSTLAESMHRHGSVTEAATDLFAAVEAYSERREDDWTLLLVMRKSEASS